MDALQLRHFQARGLLKDLVCSENALVLQHRALPPLMIDPQMQASAWVKAMGAAMRTSTLRNVGKHEGKLESDKETDDAIAAFLAADTRAAPQSEAEEVLQVVQLSDRRAARRVEAALTSGSVLFVEDLSADDLLHPTDSLLAPLIRRETFRSLEGEQMVTLVHDRPERTAGGANRSPVAVAWHPDFELLMATKLTAPLIRADLACRVAVLNFTVTEAGLQDRFLAMLVTNERPDLAASTRALELANLRARSELRTLQGRILLQLQASSAEVLEDDSLVESMGKNRETAALLGTKLYEEVGLPLWHALAWRCFSSGARMR